jgi:hypothetical protein
VKPERKVWLGHRVRDLPDLKAFKAMSVQLDFKEMLVKLAHKGWLEIRVQSE